MEEPQGVETSEVTEAPVSSPETTEAPQSQEAPKSKEYNFKQMRESLSRFENEKKQWTEERQKLQGAAAIDQLLRKDPRSGLKQIAQALGVDLKTLIEAQEQKSEMPQINFDEYEPSTAQLLKFLHSRASEVDNLKQWKSEFEQRIEQDQRKAQETHLQRNTATLEEHFQSDLIKDGYLDKEGNGDQDVVDLIRGAIVERLSQHGDPRLATVEQYQQARAQVLKGLSAHKSKTLQNTVTKGVPPSGSRNGSATTAKVPVSREQRLAFLEDFAKTQQNWGFES